MEGIRGKKSMMIERADLDALARDRGFVALDVGAGDGKYLRRLAEHRSSGLFIGLDTCREQLRAVSWAAPANAVYLIGDARALPGDLAGIAHLVTVTFPWGSLLRALLDQDGTLVAGLYETLRPGGRIEVALNAGALEEQGWSLEEGSRGITRNLSPWLSEPRVLSMESKGLARLGTTWGKRLAAGRDPRGFTLTARRPLSADAEGVA
jgi:16S rRNA (adenine(1408)-N(1))-methyltransferase